MEIFPGISIDPHVRFGKPCLTGTRIDVATLMGALAAGEVMWPAAAGGLLCHPRADIVRASLCGTCRRARSSCC